MTIVKRNGTHQNQFPDLFDDFLNCDIFNWGQANFSDTGTTIPAVNIKETIDSYDVEVAAPRMEKKYFKVLLEDNTLTISSLKALEKKRENDGRYTKCEFSYQYFSRTFTLQKRRSRQRQHTGKVRKRRTAPVDPKKGTGQTKTAKVHRDPLNK